MPFAEYFKLTIAPKLKRWFAAAWLPLLLAVLFVLQNQEYNRWLNVIPSFYFVRRTLVTFALGSLLYGPAVFFNKRYAKYIYLLVISFLLSLIFVAQYLFYAWSGGFLQASALSYADVVGHLGGTIKTLLTPKLLFFILNIFIVIAAWIFSYKNYFAEIILSLKEKIVAIVLIILIVTGGYGFLIKVEIHDWGDATRLYSQIYDLATLVGKVGVVNFYLEDLVKYVFQARQVTPQQQSFVSDWAKTHQPIAKASDFGLAKGRNLIFIQVESLENWIINYKINGQEITPNLNRLASQGRYWTNYYSQISEGNTADAEFVTLNSLYPLPDAVAFISKAQNQYAALPSLLKNNGYYTSVMHGDVATFWNRSNMYPALGYEKDFSSVDYKISRPVGFDGLGDDDFFQQALPQMKTLPQPFMDTLITLSMHTPFEIPSDLQTLNIPQNDTSLTPTEKTYAQSAHYTDMALGKFIEGLKQDGLYNNSLIFIFGDHHAFLGTPDSQTNHVPLIMLAPGLNLGGIDKTPASHLDLYPTAADLLGISPPVSVLGQDVLNSKTPVVTERAVGSGAVKFIISSDLKYTGSADGIFKDGSCAGWPQLQPLPIDDCQALYNQQLTTTQVSDIVVRFNQLHLLLNPK